MTQWPFELSQEPAAIVKNNNAPHWTAIVETKPNVTLDLGTKLYTQEQVNACITAALRWAAEQCDDLRATGITSDAGMFVREADLIDAAVRILAALPKE